MGKVSFDLIGTNCFHIKAEKEMFSTVGLRCRQNLKFKNWPTLGAYHLLKAGAITHTILAWNTRKSWS